MKSVFYYTDSKYKPELESVLRIVEQQFEVTFNFTDKIENAQIAFNSEIGNDIYFPSQMYDRIYAPNFSAANELKHDKIIVENGKVDYIGTVFYLINCVQEYNAGKDKKDSFDRFKSEHSFQVKNNIEKQNYVAVLIDKFVSENLAFLDFKKQNYPTKIFLSHDIDNIYGSIKQDSFWSIRNQQWNSFFKIVIENIFENPGWLNIDKIMKIESEYDFKSTFFWLVKKGATTYGLSNSDYEVKNIERSFQMAQKAGWYNGLHKSVGNNSFAEEIQELPGNVQSNRFHYLRFNPHQDFEKIEQAKLKLDCSLGFPDKISMRNSYALPYHPFDLKNRRSFSFLECPLHMMDTTYHNYNKTGAETFTKEVIEFVESNNTNSVLSLLFHNNFISEYKFSAYLKTFKTLLSYFYESGIGCITEQEIIDKYGAGN